MVQFARWEEMICLIFKLKHYSNQDLAAVIESNAHAAENDANNQPYFNKSCGLLVLISFFKNGKESAIYKLN